MGGEDYEPQVIWNEKVAAYLAYWVDGGIYQSRFTLCKMIEAAKKAYDENGAIADLLSQELAYLLNIRTKKQPIKNEDKPYISRALKTLQEVSGDYAFNEQVMVSILELQFAELEFEKDGDYSFYGFVRFLLNNKNFSEDVQMWVCRVIILLFNDKDKKKAKALTHEESKNISAQQVVQPLIDIYTNGKRALKELACDALLNMGLSDMEYIEVMVESGFHNRLIDNMLTPHQPLLFKSLRCFQLLITIYRNLADLLDNVEQLFQYFNNIMRTFGDPKLGIEYSIEIKNLIFKILFTILKNYKPEDTSKRDEVISEYDSFITCGCRQLKSLFINPLPEEGKVYDKELTFNHQDYNVRLLDTEKGYCRTLLSFCIQYCNDERNATGNFPLTL